MDSSHDNACRGDGRIQDGRMIFDTPADGSLLIHENKLMIGGLHVVINLQEKQAT